jgi:hypothetical protein
MPPAQGAELRFKNPDDEPKLPLLDWRLRFLLRLVLTWAGTHGIATVVVTDIDSPVKRVGREHQEHRALDLRLLLRSLDLSEELAAWLNDLFDAAGHPVAVVGKVDPTGHHDDHIHLQVSPPFQAAGKIAL